MSINNTDDENQYDDELIEDNNYSSVCATEIPRKVYHIRLITNKTQDKYTFNSMLFIGIKPKDRSVTEVYKKDKVPITILENAKIHREDLGESVWIIKEFIDSDDTLGFIRFRIASVLNLPSAYIAMWAQDNDGAYTLLGTKYYYNLTMNAIQERLEQTEKVLTDVEQNNLVLYMDELKQRNLALRKKKAVKGRKKAEKGFEDTIQPYKQAIYNPDPFAYPVPDHFFMPDHIAKSEIFLVKEDAFILEDYDISTTTINAASIIDFTKWIISLPEYNNAITNPNLTEQTKELIASHMIKYWPNYCRTPPGASENSITVCEEGGDQSYSIGLKQQMNVPIGPVYTVLGFDFTDVNNPNRQKELEKEIKNAASYEKSRYDSSIENVSSEVRYAKDLIWRPDLENLKLDSCSIIETVIHVNYDTGSTAMVSGLQSSEIAGSKAKKFKLIRKDGVETDFVDLLKIFDNFPLSKETPFIKFRGDESNEGFHKVDRSIVDNVTEDELKRWISNKTTIKTADGIKYTVFGKGLSLKTEIYKKDNVTRYATIFISRDGKIEIKASWDEEMHADLKDVVKMIDACRKTIETINMIDYHLPRTSRNRMIGLPNSDFNKMFTNTKIVLINAISQFTAPGIIDFDELNDLARTFHKSFANVLASDIGFEGIGMGRKVITKYHPLLKLRYNRISNFENMSSIQKFVYDLVQQLSKKQVNEFYARPEGQTALANLAVNYFLQRGDKVAAEDIKKNFPDESKLAKSTLKHPGVDVKIRPTAKLNTYKIHILGAKGINQMRRIHFFVTKLISLYFSKEKRAPLDFYWERLNKTDAVKNIPVIENINAEIIDNEEKHKQEVLDAKAEIIDDIRAGEYGDIVSDESDSEDEDVLIADLASLVKDSINPAKIEAINDLFEDGIPAESLEEDYDERKEREKEKVAAAAAKAKARKSSKPMTKLGYLETYDSEIVPKGQNGQNGYARRCQPVGRQPIVLSNEEYDTMIQRLNNEKEAAANPSVKKEKLDSINMVSGEKGVLSYRGNSYMCPLAFCHTDHEPLATMEQVVEHRDRLKHFVSVQEADVIPGFLRPKTDTGLCMPCCFKRSGITWKKGILECLAGQTADKKGTGNIQSGNKEEVGGIIPGQISDDQFRYILKAKKNQIIIPDGGRLGHLPEYLANILNVDKSCDTSNTAGSAADGFNCYVRMGMPSNSVNKPNTFLNVIGDIIPNPGSPYGIPGSEVRKLLIDTLRDDPDVFEGLMDGSLKIIFTERDNDTALATQGNDKDKVKTDPEENFISFLESQPINETLLWDFVTKPGVITENGFNLFIIEAVVNKTSKSKGIGNYIFICPNGYNISKVYNPSRKSLVLFKYMNHYEPIYRAQVENRQMKIFKEFDSSHSFIQTLVEMLNQCKPYNDKKAEIELSKYYSRIKERQIKFKESQPADEIYTLINDTPHNFAINTSFSVETDDNDGIDDVNNDINDINDINDNDDINDNNDINDNGDINDNNGNKNKKIQVGGVKKKISDNNDDNEDNADKGRGKEKVKNSENMKIEIVGQIVDSYNKTIYLVLNNGLKLPVDPSQKIPHLEEVEYDKIPDLDYVTTVKTLLDLYNFYQIRGYILQNVVGGDGKTVHGLLLDTGLMLTVKPISKEKLNEIGTIYSDIDVNLAISQKDLEDTVNFMTMESVDRMILSNQIDNSEKRVMSNARRFFEAETYQRIRFELSKWLNSDEKLKSELYDILNSPGSMTAKRKEAYDWLYGVISDMSTNKGRNNEDYLIGYHTPNVRRVCLGMINCGKDPHCQFDESDGICKLFIPKKNLINGKLNIPYYSHLLSDELVRNNFKRAEILDDRIDNYISRVARTIRPNEILFADSDPEKIDSSIKELYMKTIDWDRKRKEFYTIKNPETFNINMSPDENLGLYADMDNENIDNPIIQEGAKPNVTLDILDAHFNNILEPVTGFRQIVFEGTEDLIFEHIANALNQKAEFLGFEPRETALSIKKNIVNFLEKEMEPEILPNGSVNREGWKLYLDNMKLRYPAEFDKIYNLKEVVTNDDEADATISLSTEISSKNHRLNEHDLSIISRVYNVKFITLRHQLLHGETKDSKRLNCLETTQTLEPWTIMLYYVGRDKWRLIINTAYTPSNTSKDYQYIWNQTIPELSLPYKFYNQYYLPECGKSDQKKKIDPANTTLMIEEARRRKLLFDQDLGKVKRTIAAPITSDIEITSPRKKKLIPLGLIPRGRVIPAKSPIKPIKSPVKPTKSPIKSAEKDIPTEPIAIIPESEPGITEVVPPIFIPGKTVRIPIRKPIIKQNDTSAPATPESIATREARSPRQEITPVTPGPVTPGPVTPGPVTPGPVTPGPTKSLPKIKVAKLKPLKPLTIPEAILEPDVSQKTSKPIKSPGSPRSKRDFPGPAEPEIIEGAEKPIKRNAKLVPMPLKIKK